MTERLFYDGNCGLCHGAVRFVLARDREGVLFRFAPIGGRAFLGEIPEDLRGDIPDSVIVKTAEGRILFKWRAALYVLKRVGGLWRLWGLLLALVPVPIGDALYDFVARNRHRFFRRPQGTCPTASPRLLARFDE